MPVAAENSRDAVRMAPMFPHAEKRAFGPRVLSTGIVNEGGFRTQH